jgi:23S rRNA (uracil1939-C5)-methyltransferase
LTSSGAAEAAADLTPPPIILDDMLENGQGVGRIGGLVAFVTGGLPGETVKVAVDQRKRNYVSGHVAAIERRSADRVTPGCAVFPRCGGCQTLHYRRAAELAWKKRLVANALTRIGGLMNVPVDDAVCAQDDPEDGYRNKVSLVVRGGEDGVRLGFFEARSHNVVAIKRCPVLLPRLNAAVECIVKLARENPALFAGLRHVVARASATCADLVVSLNGLARNPELERRAGATAARIPGLTGLVANWEPQGANAIFGRRWAVLWGSSITSEIIDGLRLSAGISSFFQINTAILQRIVERMTALAAGAGRVVDLYCGVGTFAIVLGKRGMPGTGVESYAPAVEEAMANAAQNGITCAAFERADVARALAGPRGDSLLQGAGIAILDPPRKGCEPQVLSALGKHRVRAIAYLSCNPATLARDAKMLAANGYKLVRATPFDMFPGTGHVEVLGEFRLDG